MKGIGWPNLLGFFLVGLVLSVSAIQLLAGSGLAFPVSPNSLLVTLPLTGIVVYLASWPIYRYRKAVEAFSQGPRPARPNPFYAFRVMVLARATTMAGSLFLGWHVGAGLWLLAFSVAPGALLGPTGFGVLGSAVMVGGGLLGQFNCRAPKSGDGEELA
jgi:hypothetical protein